MKITLKIKHPESFRTHVFAVDCNTDHEDFFVENIRLCYIGRERAIEVSDKIYELLENEALSVHEENYYFEDEEGIW